MIFSRRRALSLLGAATLRPHIAFADVFVPKPHTAGSFEATTSSLKAYTPPAWFGDAKFGIWAHWGPQSGIEQGDWYAHYMYVQGERQYKQHLATYGHPSKVGYKDLVPLFKAERWDPDHLMDLYQKAGAKYFFSMGVHHDNFDMWNSKYQPRWNAMATGPKRDIVGEWRVAARKRGMHFGVSEHLSNSYDWLAVSHTSDSTGPLAGVPYDGVDPAYADLYHDLTGEPAGFAATVHATARIAPDAWKQEYLRRVQDLVDQHQPDLLYTDGGIPFQEYGYANVAEVYNVSEKQHNGRNEAVFLGKSGSECKAGICTLDRERSISDVIMPEPWQTDTCIGNWHYQRGEKYKTAKMVIDLFVDIISKNGNLLLNFPLPNSGELDPQEMTVLQGITQWMQTNAEGIYSTRPWKTNGDGPDVLASRALAVAGQSPKGYNERNKADLGAQDVRYTTKGSVIYAFVQGWPKEDLLLASLGTASSYAPPKIKGASVLGRNEQMKFIQEPAGLRVSFKGSPTPGSEIGVCLKLMTA